MITYKCSKCHQEKTRKQVSPYHWKKARHGRYFICKYCAKIKNIELKNELTCSKCKNGKILDEFSPKQRKNGFKGLYCLCKKCARDKQKIYREDQRYKKKKVLTVEDIDPALMDVILDITRS